MQKLTSYLPYLALALLVILGAYLLLSPPIETPLPSEEVTEEGTPSPSEEPQENGTEEAPASGGISLPQGLQIVSQTAWATFTDPDWALSFKYQQGWKVGKTDRSDGTLEQVSVAAGTLSILIQEDKPIAHPALVESEVSTRTIAGQEVEVHEYIRPNETYAYYVYFTLSDGNDDFFFSLRSKSEDRENMEEFIERLSMK